MRCLLRGRIRLVIGIFAVGLFGCESSVEVVSTRLANAPDEVRGERQSLDEATVNVGFAGGSMRQQVKLAAFSISRFPVSVEQYRACVTLGSCHEVEASCAGHDLDEDDAMLCVGESNAAEFCAWAGGSLPSLSQWLYAARGPEVARYPWGEEKPSCEQHPWGDAASGNDPTRRSRGSINLTSCNQPKSKSHRLGLHEAGASPAGVQDVLIAKAELLGGNPGEMFSVCGGEDGGCLVYGLEPGAVDAVGPVPVERQGGSEGEQLGEVVPSDGGRLPYSFRCVWSREGK